MLSSMTDITCILSAIEHGDPHAAEQLLPLVYSPVEDARIFDRSFDQ